MNGSGKTHVASRYICKYLINGESVICAAQTHKQVKKVLFKAILQCLRKWKIRFKVNQTDLTITTEFGSECYCYSYSEVSLDNIRGLTGISLVVVDEAALASKEFIDVAIACCRGMDVYGRRIGAPRLLLISTPKAHSYLNKLIQEAGDDCEIIHATTMDNTTLDERYAKRLLKDYGNTSFALQEVYGQIIDDTEPDQLMSWVEIESMKTRTPFRTGDRVLGLDMARYGDDSNSFWYREGSYLERIAKIQNADTYKLYDVIASRYSPSDLDVINIDGTGGYGGGLSDMLKHHGYNVNECVYSSKAPDPKYFNLRAHMYKACSIAVSANLYLPAYDDTDRIEEELAAQKIILRETDDKFQLLSKDKIKQALGRSPDDSDGIALTFAHVRDLKGDIYRTHIFNAVETSQRLESEINALMTASNW